MSKLYIFGIGGTGSRVIKSLTMLLGSGVKINADSIVPIIIDPDKAAADLTRTIKLIKDYNSIRSFLDFNTSSENQFFRTKIEDIISDYRLRIPHIEGKKFKEFLGLNTMRNENSGNYNSNYALAKMLFSEDNLEDDMQVGFKGNPNVGSVVLNQFVKTKEFNDFAASFKQGDRIFIISSIFGGTGASGFPLLLKNLRGIDSGIASSGNIQKAPIGAISVLPYFDVKQESNSRIDSSTFISKTTSALSYYERNINGNQSLNAMYFIADNITRQYDNSEGGVNQQNDAHFVELAAALSIIDFADIQESELQGNTTFKEFAIEKDTKEIILNDLGKNTQAIINRPLTQFLLLTKYVRERSTICRNVRWAIDQKFDDRFFTSSFYSNSLKNYCDSYWEWLNEMSRNNRSFSPFTIDENGDNLFSIVKGISPSKVLTFKYFNKKNYTLFDTVLNVNEKNISKDKCVENRFLELFYKSTKEIVNLKFQF